MDKKDLLILSNLRMNARASLTDISKSTKVPISTIFDKLRVHQNEKLIKKHTALLDFNKLGYPVKAKILIKVNKNKKEEIRNFLLYHPNVNSLFQISNGYNFLIEVVFKQISQLEEFSELLEDKYDIRTKQVYFVIEDIKREEFMSKPESLEALGF
ncbi:Lrp/AsnC ligand binding domain-containing protein [Candidatus Woesearchaeota archaeon]|nr:Lrp/AsnC ligand binding domain-containing protein [Candidatus Woesearchaeota archaeon]